MKKMSPVLRNFLILFGLAVLTSGYTVYSNVKFHIEAERIAKDKGIVTGARAPDFAYVTANGKDKGRLSDYKGKIVILNFWASWCAPCVAEFPQLLSLAAAYPDDVVLLALSSDHDKAMMDRFLARLIRENGAAATAPNVIIAWDQGSKITQPVYGTVRLPETIIIDRTQTMRDKVAGAIDWDAPEIRAQIGALSRE